jgi:hypothetical protein
MDHEQMTIVIPSECLNEPDADPQAATVSLFPAPKQWQVSGEWSARSGLLDQRVNSE